MSSEGFLVKKTIQQFPIRQRPLYYEDYTDQNLLLFINKKLADMRFQSGNNDLPARKLINLKIQTPRDGLLSLKKSNIIEDEILQRPPSPPSPEISKTKHYKFKSPPVKPEVKLGAYLNDELLRQHYIAPLYQEYKLANLKVNLQKMKSQRQFKLQELNHIEFDDNEQVRQFLQQICRNHPEIEISQMLKVDVEKKSLLQDNKESKLKNLILTKLKQEDQQQLQQIEQNYTKNLVHIYKETRYDQFEPEFKKQAQINMCKIKKQKEIQDKMFADIFKMQKSRLKQQTIETEPENQSIKQLSLTSRTNKFDSKHKSTFSQQFNNNIFISQPSQLSPTPLLKMKPSQMTTSVGTFTDSIRSPTNSCDFSRKMKTIMDKCEQFESQQRKEKGFYLKKMKTMNKDLHFQLDSARTRYDNVDLEFQSNEGFEQFLQENQFKRKLIEYKVGEVQNLYEVLSQKAKIEQTKNFLIENNSQKEF